jgi:hypothetical protein
MSVNGRDDYQFIPPHSEGGSFMGTQLASFYCYENTTDGGVSILLNVNGRGDAWSCFREQVRRGRVPSRPLAKHEMARVRGLYQLKLPEDLLREDDQILSEHESVIPNLTIIEALAKARTTYSSMLDLEVYVYWDTLGSIDRSSAPEYERLLRQCDLLKEPQGGIELQQLDNAAGRRIWTSHIPYSQIFRCKITRKLAPGDFIIMNNLTWCHSASNWTPGSGVRRIVASFA